MSAWHTKHIVRFSHCDPAGIVFYPRFFEIVHEAKEDGSARRSACPFAS